MGPFPQVVREDNQAATALLQRACARTREAGGLLTLFEVVRHLECIDVAAGRMESALTQFEESATLRPELGWRPGLAASWPGRNLPPRTGVVAGHWSDWMRPAPSPKRQGPRGSSTGFQARSEI
ncbi:MAG TPA: hypothetical protein VNF24_02315 [Candidatus Acidoferrales bacterium]|nr:hypothetical protein [Candidatus Acidoferrales bacterium]